MNRVTFQDKYLMDMDELFSQVDEKRKVGTNISNQLSEFDVNVL